MANPTGLPYTPAVAAGDWVVVSGQLGLVDGALVADFAGEVDQALANLADRLAEHGLGHGARGEDHLLPGRPGPVRRVQRALRRRLRRAAPGPLGVPGGPPAVRRQRRDRGLGLPGLTGAQMLVSRSSLPSLARVDLFLQEVAEQRRGHAAGDQHGHRHGHDQDDDDGDGAGHGPILTGRRFEAQRGPAVPWSPSWVRSRRPSSRPTGPRPTPRPTAWPAPHAPGRAAPSRPPSPRPLPSAPGSSPREGTDELVARAAAGLPARRSTGCGPSPCPPWWPTTSTRLRGGFLGVDVFFVISGFLITRLLLAERERTGAHRARRVLDPPVPAAAAGAARGAGGGRHRVAACGCRPGASATSASTRSPPWPTSPTGASC